MAQLTIDLQNKEDRFNALVALYSVASKNNDEILFCPIEKLLELKDEYSKLQDDYETCKREKRDLDGAYDDIRKVKENLESQNSKLQDEIRNLENTNLNLSIDLEKLKEELSKYVVGFGLDDKEIEYYKPKDGGVLERSAVDKVCYKGCKKGDRVEFQFNDEKVSHTKFIDTRLSDIEPFCDIEGPIPNNANRIENLDKGMFTTENGVFKLIKRAKVAFVYKS